MLLYILLAIAVFMMLAEAYLIYLYVTRIDVLIRAYESLDQGMAEITDAYETDSLQYEDTIEKLNHEMAQYKENNSTLLHNIAVDRQARHELQRRNDEQAASIDGLRRQLDIAQRIISEHDMNCLPHIVLSSMEEDTPLPI